jgi:hypothetical protein
MTASSSSCPTPDPTSTKGQIELRQDTIVQSACSVGVVGVLGEAEWRYLGFDGPAADAYDCDICFRTSSKIFHNIYYATKMV